MRKKDKQHAIRISSDLYVLAKQVMETRSITNFSEYIRGLVLIDIAYHYIPIDPGTRLTRVGDGSRSIPRYDASSEQSSPLREFTGNPASAHPFLLGDELDDAAPAP